MPSPIYTFANREVLASAKLNTNFQVLTQCVAKSGDTLTGTISTRLLQPSTTLTYDLGTASALYSSVFLKTLKLSDSDNSHTVAISVGSNVSANRTLSIVTGDANRTLTFSGNPTLNDWFDQAVKTTSSPYFTAMGIGGTPSYPIHVAANADSGQYVMIANPHAGTTAEAKFGASNGTDLLDVGMTGTGFTTSGIFTSHMGFIHTNASGGLGFGTNTGAMLFSAQGDITQETMRLESGRVGIGLGNGVTPVYKLDVRSTATTGNVTGMRLYRGTANTADTNALLWQANALLTASISDEVTSGTTGSLVFKTNNGSGLVETFRIGTAGDATAIGTVRANVGFNVNGSAGVTASGTFTNFTIVGGIIIAAS